MGIDWENAIDFSGIWLYNVMYDVMIGEIGEAWNPVMKYLMTIKEVKKWKE